MKPDIPERYEIISELGAGGMGSVYLALDNILDKRVAVKVLAKRSIADDPKVIQRFQREAMAAGKLAHQNLVSTLDFDISPSGQPLDYAEGMTLKEYLAEEGPLPLDLVQDIFEQVLSGIAHAHKEGVVHRDLKTSNIILVSDEDGKKKAMVIDFGIALILEDGQSASDLTRTNAVLGSPLYMSPEQVRAEKADERSDIYSLGCVLYECLTGTPPYRGESALHTMEMHLNLPTPDVTGLFGSDTDLEERLNFVLAKALAKVPPERFSTVDQFATALSEALIEPEHSDNTVYRGKRSSEAKETHASRSSMFLIVGSFLLVTCIFLTISSAALLPILKPLPKEPARAIELFVPLPENKEIEEDFLTRPLERIASQRGQILHLPGEHWSRQNFIELKASSAAGLIRSISIPYSKFDDPADIGLLKDLNITSLNLSTTNFDDGGAAELAKFKNLQALKIGGCKGVTDEGIKSISEITTLTSLDIGGGITGESLKYILKLKNLTSLDLKVIGDLKPEHLSLLSTLKLTCLFIHNRNLSTEDLKAIAEVKTLEKLKLTAVKIIDTDKTGMEALARMNRLQSVELYDTEYSLEALKRFHALNPRCQLLEENEYEKLLPINLEEGK
mgnify:CR=1 FL=1